MPTLVPREHLPNAISLNTIATADRVGRRAGARRADDRARAASAGSTSCNALSFLFVIAALLADEGPGPDAHRGHGRARPRQLHRRGGARRAALRVPAPLIRSTMLLDFFATFFSSATALLPIFAQDILHVGARGYGWLYAAPAAGAAADERASWCASSIDRATAGRSSSRRLRSTAWRRSSSASRRRSG